MFQSEAGGCHSDIEGSKSRRGILQHMRLSIGWEFSTAESWLQATRSCYGSMRRMIANPQRCTTHLGGTA
jgi:hypothetical protein